MNYHKLHNTLFASSGRSFQNQYRCILISYEKTAQTTITTKLSSFSHGDIIWFVFLCAGVSHVKIHHALPHRPNINRNIIISLSTTTKKKSLITQSNLYLAFPLAPSSELCRIFKNSFLKMLRNKNKFICNRNEMHMKM